MVRLKNRYIVLQIEPRDPKDSSNFTLSSDAIMQVIKDKIEQLHGDFGMASIQAGFTAKYCNEYTKIAIARARHGPHKLVSSSIPFINKIGTRNVNVRILYIGATIKKCFCFIKQYQEKAFEEVCVKLKTPEERRTVREAINNFQSALKSME
ncbi:ribonuclease P/MRP protein subunit POP5-like [Sitophilus oryzae]|uniref:Ribonuclease P/MRP protein subunit POP5 n=1 Tax=Sitophilus oryzae TaxID=7048 RepID=A0A6J2Y1K9_SITOR|nr:ribonuclease P/MRP protein subunit POP5-like [Sitophilus oryzae]